jgi:hypothetical protein
MPRKKKSAAVRPSSPTYLVNVSDLYGDALERVERVRADGRLVAPEIIDAILTSDPDGDNLADSVIALIAARRHRAHEYRDAIAAFCETLKKANFSTRVPIADRNNHFPFVDDVAFDFAIAYSSAAYALGILVGRAMAGAR